MNEYSVSVHSSLSGRGETETAQVIVELETKRS